MKIARFFGVLFGILGVILLVGTAILCFVSLDAPTEVAQIPQAGLDCAQEVMDALGSGDWEKAAARMYGQPDLGVSGTPESPEAQKLWQAFRKSLTYEFIGPCYVTDSGFARNVMVSALNVPSVTGKVSVYARELLNARIAAATEMEELYDETGEFRADLMAEIMTQALDKALAQGGEMDTVDVTLGLVCRDGTWWAVPDQALLKLLAGGA